MEACTFYTHGVCKQGDQCEGLHRESDISARTRTAIKIRNFLAQRGGQMHIEALFEEYAAATPQRSASQETFDVEVCQLIKEHPHLICLVFEISDVYVSSVDIAKGSQMIAQGMQNLAPDSYAQGSFHAWQSSSASSCSDETKKGPMKKEVPTEQDGLTKLVEREYEVPSKPVAPEDTCHGEDLTKEVEQEKEDPTGQENPTEQVDQKYEEDPTEKENPAKQLDRESEGTDIRSDASTVSRAAAPELLTPDVLQTLEQDVCKSELTAREKNIKAQEKSLVAHSRLLWRQQEQYRQEVEAQKQNLKTRERFLVEQEQQLQQQLQQQQLRQQRTTREAAMESQEPNLLAEEQQQRLRQQHVPRKADQASHVRQI